MAFLAWSDDAPKVDVATKIGEGAAAPDAQVRQSDSISNANTFYFGCEGAVVIAARPPSDAPRTSGEPRGKTRR
jgi:hypothetical protein